MYVDNGPQGPGWFDQQGCFHPYNIEKYDNPVAELQKMRQGLEGSGLRGGGGGVVGTLVLLGAVMGGWMLWLYLQPKKRRR